jgi:poly(A) polymerase
VSDPAPQRSAPIIIPRAGHAISRADISDNALKVMYRLQRSGFLAYLVGGAVRDLLLGRRPKDFDIGTNARPQQVRQLFRNARLIGRRFRLARILFTDEIVEVATFRRSPDPPETDEGADADVLAPAADVDEYGTPEEDAWRRDFTINGLFYNIADFTVIDHVGGLADLECRRVRSIGPAPVRFQEDPVRMMRAVEYAARLGFTIDDEASEAIAELSGEIRRAAPARIAYELTESLTGGSAHNIFQGLLRNGLLDLILPEVVASHDGESMRVLWRLLQAADETIRRGGRLAIETLLALLFMPSVVDSVRRVREGATRQGELELELRGILDPPTRRLALSNFRSHLLRNALSLLPRLLSPPRSVKQAIRTIKRDSFPVAWQVLEIVSEVTGMGGEGRRAWQVVIDRLQAGLPPLAETPAGRRRTGGRSRPRHRRGSADRGKTKQGT